VTPTNFRPKDITISNVTADLTLLILKKKKNRKKNVWKQK